MLVPQSFEFNPTFGPKDCSKLHVHAQALPQSPCLEQHRSKAREVGKGVGVRLRVKDPAA